VIDPGHGGADRGVQAEGLNEADAVLEIARSLKDSLKAEGVEAMLTRSDDSSMSLQQRVALANTSGASAFVSLHLNYSPSPSAKGLRLFIPKPGTAAPKDQALVWDNAAESQAAQARVLASSMARALEAGLGQKASMQSLNMGIFKGLSLAGVVVELGFLSHAETLQGLKDPAQRKAMASSLAEGIKAWAESQPSPAQGGAKP
jgi:N-acetylmuramoyl-L-alanine amidase